MAIHFTECAALTELPASKKLVLMACADSADKDSRIAKPGLENVCRWSGLKKSRALEVIAELVAEGYLVRRSSGRAGRRAEFYVFPAGCCALHGPLHHITTGSGAPDPQPEVQGPEEGPTATGPLPSSEVLTPQPPATAGGDSTSSNTAAGRKRPSRGDGTNPRALRAAAEREAAQRAQDRAAADRRTRLQAIAACNRCSKAGYLPSGRVCDHDPGTEQRAARGLELVRDELTKRKRRAS